MSVLPVVDVHRASKILCRDVGRSLWYGLQDITGELFGRSRTAGRALRKGEFWALDKVDLKISPGEAVGIVGPNGAGKSTMLRMLDGLIRPDSGRVVVRGRVGALIALGTGFNPLLTGRENVYLNAALNGMSRREVACSLEEIVEFSEVGDVIDAPVKSYSSGMVMRLGFAVAAHLKPQLLLVDEVLAVGDVRFQTKCLNKLQSLKQEGTAIAFVSHAENQVRHLADHCLLLHRGKTLSSGEPNEVFREYQRLDASRMTRTDLTPLSGLPSFSAEPDLTRLDDGRFRIEGERTVAIEVRYHGLDVATPDFQLRVWNSSGNMVAVLDTSDVATISAWPAAGRLRIVLDASPLLPGHYRIACGFMSQGKFLSWNPQAFYLDVEGAESKAQSGLFVMPFRMTEVEHADEC